MPRFAANLAYLFTERPLPERIGAAKAAGFGAVEFQMPYDHAPGVLKAEIERHGVAVLGLNTTLGRPGEAGLAAVPSRAEPDEGEINYPAIYQALDRVGYTGWVACEYRPRGRTEDGLGWGKAYGLGRE